MPLRACLRVMFCFILLPAISALSADEPGGIPEPNVVWNTVEVGLQRHVWAHWKISIHCQGMYELRSLLWMKEGTQQPLRIIKDPQAIIVLDPTSGAIYLVHLDHFPISKERIGTSYLHQPDKSNSALERHKFDHGYSFPYLTIREIRNEAIIHSPSTLTPGQIVAGPVDGIVRKSFRTLSELDRFKEGQRADQRDRPIYAHWKPSQKSESVYVLDYFYWKKYSPDEERDRDKIRFFSDEELSWNIDTNQIFLGSENVGQVSRGGFDLRNLYFDEGSSGAEFDPYRSWQIHHVNIHEKIGDDLIGRAAVIMQNDVNSFGGVKKTEGTVVLLPGVRWENEYKCKYHNDIVVRQEGKIITLPMGKGGDLLLIRLKPK